MKPAALPRRFVAAGLLALGLFTLAAPTSRADAVADARTALVAGDFVAAKALLDPVLSAQPAHGEAAFLRALARVGLAVETRVPAFAAKLGAKSAVVDLGEDAFDIVFKPTLAYETVTPLAVTNGVYRVPTMQHGPVPAISFENRGSAPCPLVLAASFGAVQNRPLAIGLWLDDDDIGDIFVGRHGIEAWGSEDIVTYDFANQRITLRIPAGSAATLEFYQAPSDAAFSIVGKPPATLLVRNGKRVDEARPTFASGANLAWLFTFLAQTDAETLGPVVADLAVPAPGFSLTFASDETGAAQDITVAYADTRLLLAEINAFRALRRLLESYNLSQPLASLLSADGPEILLRNSAFLTPRTASASLNAGRVAARGLFQEALRHYADASDAGAWTRGAPPSGGAYLFAVDADDPVALEQAKVDFETALAQFETALAGSAPVVELSDGLAADPTIPDGAGLSFAPLFGAPAVNLRGILPTVGENGVVRGTSSKLLASGLLTGFGTAAWEDYLVSSGLADLQTAARQTGPVIQRHPATLTTVAEGDDAALVLTAECYPAPTYRWFKRVGSAYVPIEDATSPALAFAPATREDAGIYLCKVTNLRVVPPRVSPVAATISSRVAKVVVTYPPEIVEPPAPVVRYTGKKVSLSAKAIGVPAVRYQWFKGETAVTPVRATPAYSFVASAARAGDYRVVVTNERGSASSDPVGVDVQTKPVFTTQPVARTVAVGQPVTFTVAATGNPTPQIRWRKDGKNLPDAFGPELTIEAVALADRGVYTAVAFSTVQTGPVATAVASTVSAGARLVVTR